jgi:hypothetical protein
MNLRLTLTVFCVGAVAAFTVGARAQSQVTHPSIQIDDLPDTAVISSQSGFTTFDWHTDNGDAENVIFDGTWFAGTSLGVIHNEEVKIFFSGPHEGLDKLSDFLDITLSVDHNGMGELKGHFKSDNANAQDQGGIGSAGNNPVIPETGNFQELISILEANGFTSGIVQSVQARSDVNDPVPDAGATSLMLGFAFLCLSAIRRLVPVR